MTDLSPADVMSACRELWGPGLDPTAENLSAAAVGLASSWFRNTEAVEEHSHAAGPWNDADMLRKNSWATKLSVDALGAVVSAQDSEHPRVLEQLLMDLGAVLPNDRARRSLRREKGNAPAMAATWIATNGLGNWLVYLTNVFNYPHTWWGTRGFDKVVEELCSIEPGPPGSNEFRQVLQDRPWDLTDEQAQFVCDHRYEVGRS